MLRRAFSRARGFSPVTFELIWSDKRVYFCGFKIFIECVAWWVCGGVLYYTCFTCTKYRRRRRRMEREKNVDVNMWQFEIAWQFCNYYFFLLFPSSIFLANGLEAYYQLNSIMFWKKNEWLCWASSDGRDSSMNLTNIFRYKSQV